MVFFVRIRTGLVASGLVCGALLLTGCGVGGPSQTPIDMPVMKIVNLYDLPDELPYNVALWPGTHNSAINLGPNTVLRPGAAIQGNHPSEAASSYQYLNLDQRLSVLDQLEQGIRVIDLEIAGVPDTWTCQEQVANDGLFSRAPEMHSALQKIEDLVYSADDHVSQDIEHLQNLVHAVQADLISSPRHANHHRLPSARSLLKTKHRGNESAAPECNGRCSKHRHDLFGKCLSCCPFIVSHGNLDESIGANLGYTFPEDIFDSITSFVEANPKEIVTLYLISSHGNARPGNDAILARLNMTGLLDHVWNADPSAAFDKFPTIGEMRSSGRTVLITGQWGPRTQGSHVNASDVSGVDGRCVNETPCMEGWDSVTFDLLAPERAIMSKSNPSSGDIFFIDDLSSRRGRPDNSAEYFPLPNVLSDLPYFAGGNPAQAARAADYDHVLALETRWSEIIKPFGLLPNWILVDFFNTTTPTGKPSRTVIPNANDGLIRGVADINRKRVKEWLASQQLERSLHPVFA